MFLLSSAILNSTSTEAISEDAVLKKLLTTRLITPNTARERSNTLPFPKPTLKIRGEIRSVNFNKPYRSVMQRRFFLIGSFPRQSGQAKIAKSSFNFFFI